VIAALMSIRPPICALLPLGSRNPPIVGVTVSCHPLAFQLQVLCPNGGSSGAVGRRQIRLARF
jgi:hypothetical protein